MLTYSELIETLNEASTGQKNNYKFSFPEQSSKQEKEKLHATRSGVDKDVKDALQNYVKSSNTVNPGEVERDEKSSAKKKREHFQHHIKRAVGANSRENNMSAEGDGVLYRGQAHPSTVDANGHITFNQPKSWSTNPAIANANAHRNQTEDTDAHHIYVLHHKQDSGHRIVSCMPKEHCNVGHAKEEEMVSAPAKYKVIKSEHVGADVRTGKPIIRHDVEFHAHL
jgi:hypothetical protein